MSFSKTRMTSSALLLLPLIICAGCGDDNSPAVIGDNLPPELPGQGSFTLNTSALDVATISGPATRGRRNPLDGIYDDEITGRYKSDPGAAVAADSAEFANYIVGREVTAAANAAIVTAATMPAFAFSGAAFTSPVEQADGSWNWNYSLTYFANAAFDLQLNGKKVDDHVEWTMLVTTVGLTSNVTNAVWFAGESNSDNSEGFWNIYDTQAPQAGTDQVHIDWTQSAADARSSVWQNNWEGSKNYGSRLTYTEVGNDAVVEYRDAETGDESTVAWNLDSTSGSVVAPAYNNGSVACWDAGHQNQSCNQ